MENSTMKFKFSKFLHILYIASLLTGCHLFPDGATTPFVTADKYKVLCEYEYQTSNVTGNARGDTIADAYACSNGTPNASLRSFVCQSSIPAVRAQLQMMFPSSTVNNVRVTESSSEIHMANGCSLPEDVSEGSGSVTQPLTATGSQTEFELLTDNTGAILGESSLSSITGNVLESNIRVSAKFLAWRNANTTARGKIQMDGGGCLNKNNCPLVLRYLDLNIEDFTIVRPTRFARDVHITGARLYTLNNYRGMLKRDGTFQFNNLKIIVTGNTDGRQVNFMTTGDATLHGVFKGSIGNGRAVPQTIQLSLNHRTDNFRLDATVDFSITRFQAKLQSIGTNKCLRGMVNKVRELRASIESCSQPAKPQSWFLQRRGTQHQIVQPIINTCLNLKQSAQNREGGEVDIVNCSNHPDQLWTFSPDGKILHHATGKCLNVDRGRENRNGGLVSVKSCTESRDEKWKLLPVSIANTKDIPWTYIGHANNVSAMTASEGHLFAATRDNKLWIRNPDHRNIDWKLIGNVNNITAMAASGNKLFAATSDNKLLVREAIDSNIRWREIGHANNVVAMTAIDNKLFAATTSNGLWIRDAVERNINWRYIGHAKNVSALTSVFGVLFATSTDNILWTRNIDLRNPRERNWQRWGHANNVVAMTSYGSVAEKVALYAVTVDNKLWVRSPNIPF